ncbi:MAG: alpha/beta hydrolase [Phycisphaerales bacterium]|nr:alpha/beta hydrolase [Phycisphaerales bacterium]
MFESQRVGLKRGGYDVKTPNFAGFGGRDPWPIERYTMEAFAGEIAELIRRQSEGRAIVGGCSMGGYVLLALLRQWPELVAAAMFLDTRAEADTPAARASREAAITDVQLRGLEPVAGATCSRLLASAATIAVREEVEQMVRRQSIEGFIGGQKAMMLRRSQMDILPDLQQQALIIVGREDIVTPPAVAAQMAAAMPHGELVEIDHAGHLACIEQPDAVNDAIFRWLKLLNL